MNRLLKDEMHPELLTQGPDYEGLLEDQRSRMLLISRKHTRTDLDHKIDNGKDLPHQTGPKVQTVQRCPCHSAPRCKIQAGKAYLKRHNPVANIIYGNIFAVYELEVPGSKWTTPLKVIEND